MPVFHIKISSKHIQTLQPPVQLQKCAAFPKKELQLIWQCMVIYDVFWGKSVKFVQVCWGFAIQEPLQNVIDSVILICYLENACLSLFLVDYSRFASVQLVHDKFGNVQCIVLVLWSTLMFQYMFQRQPNWWFEPLWKTLVNWDDYSQYFWENKTCSKPPTSNKWFIVDQAEFLLQAGPPLEVAKFLHDTCFFCRGHWRCWT